MIILWVVVGIALVLSVILLIAFFVDWLRTKSIYAAKMSYYDFKVRYGLDPCYWILNDGYAEFVYDGHTHYVCFGFLDYLRYEIFSMKRDRDLKAKRKAKNVERLNDAFQQLDQEKEDKPDV